MRAGAQFCQAIRGSFRSRPVNLLDADQGCDATACLTRLATALETLKTSDRAEAPRLTTQHQRAKNKVSHRVSKFQSGYPSSPGQIVDHSCPVLRRLCQARLIHSVEARAEPLLPASQSS